MLRLQRVHVALIPAERGGSFFDALGEFAGQLERIIGS
jgi:hypothetical protein